MELPWLKNKKNDGGGGPPIERVADETHPGKLKEHVADELIDAYHRGDTHAFHEAFKAFHHLTTHGE